MTDWAGSTAFITGGGQGIGLGIARALAQRGVRLALADVDEAALARSNDELSRVTTVRTFHLDVRDRAAFDAVADEVEAALAPVDLLFNNAGIVPYSPAAELRYDKWDLALGVNLGGVVNGVQTFLPRMIERGEGGYIVNTSSGAGLVSDTNVLYSTTKFAVVGLSESLRSTVRRYGIDVSVLCPGPVDTDIIGNTAAADEDTSTGLHGATREAAEAFLKGGTDIDVVGTMVLDGMAARLPWIYTGDMIRPYLEQRMQSLLDSLPTPAAETSP